MERLGRVRTMVMRALALWAWAALPLAVSGPASAQWDAQTIELHPGWNAVFLEIDPAPNSCDAVFAAVPVKSVWAWNPKVPGPQYLRNPDDLLPEQPEWLTWFPKDSPQSFATDLYILVGGRAYLIQLGGNAPVSWEVKGRVLTPNAVWSQDAFNLFGAFVGGGEGPSFAEYFSPSAAHAGQRVFRLNEKGQWVDIVDTASTKIRAGEAYWLRCDGASDYTGPVSVALGKGGGELDFGRHNETVGLTLSNKTDAPRTVELVNHISQEPPAGAGEASLAGAVPLSWLDTDAKTLTYQSLDTPLTVTIPAKGDVALTLAVKRTLMTPYTPQPGTEALYQSILEVRDSGGLLYRLPVLAKSAYTEGELAVGQAQYPNSLLPGLWVGTAYVNKVSKIEDTSVLLPAAGEFPVRLILHVTASGVTNLLQQVTEMVDLSAPVSGLVKYVLVTKDELLSQYGGTDFRDGEAAGRRIASAVMVLPTGTDRIAFTRQDAALSCAIPLRHTDPLNPFLHRYHPDHDNLKDGTTEQLSDGVESYGFARSVTLTFSETYPGSSDGATTPPGWGDDCVGGTYSEIFNGVSNDAPQTDNGGVTENPICVQGAFELRRVSTVATLNNEQ